MNKKIQLSALITLISITLLGLLALTFYPHQAKADFWDDFVDFLDPTQHIGNILDGRPQDNLPPFPGFSGDDTVTTVYVNDVNTVQRNPTVDISANPLSVDFNESSTIFWNSNNSNTCNASGGTHGWSGHKSAWGTFDTGRLTSTTTYFITCSNSVGSDTDSVTVHVDDDDNDDEDPTVTLRADDTNIDFEDDTILRWSSTNADFCRASGGTNGWSGNINRSGSFNTGELTDTETYEITCENENGSDSDSVTIRVDDDNDNDDDDDNDRPEATTRSATNVETSSATLNGRADGNGSSVRAWFEYGPNSNLGYSTARNSYGSGSTNYSRSISGLLPNTTYYFRAVAENNEDTDFGSILTFSTGSNFVNVVNNQPTVILSADSTNLPFNGATTVRWFTTDASSCNAIGGSLGWAGTKNIGQGSFFTGQLTSSRTYTITCSNNFGSSTDSVMVSVRGETIVTTPVVVSRPAPTPTSIVLINSSIASNQPIVPTLDNTRPRPGDEINYTVSYQNIGNASITGVTLQIALPQEVNYMFSIPSNPTVFGNTLIFNLGTLQANGQGTVTVRARVRDNIPAGTNLNFPAILSYIDPSGLPQSVTANVTAQIWSDPSNALGANVFGAGFLPTNLFGWLLLFVMALTLALLAKYLFGSGQFLPLGRQTITLDHPLDKKITTTIHE